MDYSNEPRHDILCVDMMSFYASTECVMRGYDPLTTKLAVVGDIHRDGSVVLAATPTLKKQHKIKTGSRLYEIKKLNRKDIIVVQARMKIYLSFSSLIHEIFEMFSPPNAIHVYSVDEAWLTLDGTQKLWGNAYEAAKKIRNDIFHITGLFATVGIGDNKFLAKTVLDMYGKKKGIAEMRYEQVEVLLHPQPIEEMWGIGKQMQMRLNKLGIITIKDLAHYNVDLLKKHFGVNGIKLHEQAWGIDRSSADYDPDTSIKAFGFTSDEKPNKSVGRGITLLEDYTQREDIELVLKEIIEELSEILRRFNLEAKTLSLFIDFSKTENLKGFSRQKTMGDWTNDENELFHTCKQLLNIHYKEGTAIRKLSVSLSKLSEEQLTLDFDGKKTKQKTLAKIKDQLNSKYGKGAVINAHSLKDKSILKDRNKKIGGHYE